jgi:hypothetical protein
MRITAHAAKTARMPTSAASPKSIRLVGRTPW